VKAYYFVQYLISLCLYLRLHLLIFFSSSFSVYIPRCLFDLPICFYITFFILKKIICSWGHFALCLCVSVCLSPLSTSECLSQFLLNLVCLCMHVHFKGVLHKFLQSVCVSMLFPVWLLRNCSGTCLPSRCLATNTRNNRELLDALCCMRSVSNPRTTCGVFCLSAYRC
jgi:hypothetical protein